MISTKNIVFFRRIDMTASENSKILFKQAHLIPLLPFFKPEQIFPQPIHLRLDPAGSLSFLHNASYILFFSGIFQTLPYPSV